MKPERVFVDGRITTNDPALPRAEAFAVGSGRIVAIGDGPSVRDLAGADTEVVGLDGKIVLPGFHDAHTHLSSGALLRSRVDLRNAVSPEDAARSVEAAARTRPEGTWIRGWGFDHTRWPGSLWPDTTALDRAAPFHPVALTRIDAHAVWCNRDALARLGIRKETRDPAGGTIVRDPRTGEPTGILLETAAEQALAAVPSESDAQRKSALEAAVTEASRLGITAAEDVAEPWAIPFYAALRDGGALGVRIGIWLPFEVDSGEAEEWRRLHPPDDPYLAVTTRKAYLDGTLGSRSAALEDPYADEPGSKGLLRWDPVDLARSVGQAHEHGWSVALHAIGDQALGLALDTLGSLPVTKRARPHRIEHVQVVGSRHVARFASTGVVASVQPVHLVDDAVWVEGRLGSERARRSYPLRSILDCGGRLALGTDWPIAPLDPLRGIVAATSFRRACRIPAPEEALTVEEAIRAYTLGPATARGPGCPWGILKRGYQADFVVLSDDPSREGARVVATYVAGACRYASS